jgi:hypothetical protein
MALAVGRSYSSYDATAGWAVKGYGIGIEGTVFAADNWGMWGRAYPLNLPLQVALFGIFSDDQLPGSKLLHPLLYASLLAAVYQFWRRQHVHPQLAVVGVVFMASNPLVFLHSTLGLANLPFAVMLTLGALKLVEGVVLDDRQSDWLGGLLLATACWTRAEGIAYTAAILLGLGFSIWYLRRNRPRRLTFLIPVLLMAVSWFPFSWGSVSESHLGTAMGGFLDKLLAGQFNPRYLAEILRLYVVRGIVPSNLGLLFPVLAALLGPGLWEYRPSQYPLLTTLLVIAVVTAAMPVLLFYVRSFTRWLDFTELIIRSFDRATLPAIFMMIVTAVMLFNARWGSLLSAQGSPYDLSTSEPSSP